MYQLPRAADCTQIARGHGGLQCVPLSPCSFQSIEWKCTSSARGHAQRQAHYRYDLFNIILCQSRIMFIMTYNCQLKSAHRRYDCLSTSVEFVIVVSCIMGVFVEVYPTDLSQKCSTMHTTLLSPWGIFFGSSMKPYGETSNGTLVKYTWDY